MVSGAVTMGTDRATRLAGLGLEVNGDANRNSARRHGPQERRGAVLLGSLARGRAYQRRRRQDCRCVCRRLLRPAAGPRWLHVALWLPVIEKYKKAELQQGYFFVQEFLPGNESDTRPIQPARLRDAVAVTPGGWSCLSPIPPSFVASVGDFFRLFALGDRRRLASERRPAKRDLARLLLPTVGYPVCSRTIGAHRR